MTSYDDDILCMEHHSITTDASGNATITLDFPPTSINAIIPNSITALRHIELVSLTTNSLVILARKIATRFWNVGDVTDLPSGVTVQDELNIITAGGATTDTKSLNTEIGVQNFFTDSHTHTISQLHQHKHDLDTGTASEMNSDTSEQKATEETIQVLIIYATPPRD